MSQELNFVSVSDPAAVPLQPGLLVYHTGLDSMGHIIEVRKNFIVVETLGGEECAFDVGEVEVPRQGTRAALALATGQAAVVASTVESEAPELPTTVPNFEPIDPRRFLSLLERLQIMIENGAVAKGEDGAEEDLLYMESGGYHLPRPYRNRQCETVRQALEHLGDIAEVARDMVADVVIQTERAKAKGKQTPWASPPVKTSPKLVAAG